MKRILLVSIVILLSCSNTISHVYSREHSSDGNAEKDREPIGGFVSWSPWWLGPNVCTKHKEEIGDWKLPSQSSEREQTLGICKSIDRNTSPLISYKCIEENDKHICRLIKDYKGHNRTEITTQKCCHGYKRSISSGKPNRMAPCEKIQLPPMIDLISARLNGSYFIRIAQKNNIVNELKPNITLFMPSDAVFFDAVIKMKLRGEKSSTKIKSMITNHIVNDVLSMEDIQNDALLSTKYNNNKIRINTFSPTKDPEMESLPSLDDKRSNLYTANCEPIIEFDQMAEEGIVHVVDRILSPVTKSLMELVHEREDMTVLRTVLERTDFVEQLENVNKRFTLFAPIDKAFEQLEPRIQQIIKQGNGCAMNILKTHILDMTFCSAAVFEGYGNSVYNTIGAKLSMKRFHFRPQSFNLNRTDHQTDADNPVVKEWITINDKSKTIETDIMATNGVMHVIDTVLQTSSFSLTSYLESHNSTLFKTLLELNGISDLVDSYENVVIFAPTDSALKTTEWAKKIESDPKSLKGDADLTKFLQRHIAKPSNKTCELSSGHSLETKTGNMLHVNFYPTSKKFTGSTVNCARFEAQSGKSCGSIMYQINQPMQIPHQTIYELLKANEQYNMFLELLEIANLTSLLKHKDLRMTVLVPKNEVFTEIKKYFNELTTQGNEKELQNILKMYIVYGEYCCVAFTEPNWISNKIIMTNAHKPLDVRFNQRPWIKNAGIIKCDVLATNGIIHEISDMLTYEKEKPTPTTKRPDNSQLFDKYSRYW